jgi:glycosyltransferase involved in cell wall biosynthesis
MLCFFPHPCEEGKYLGGQERRFLEMSSFLKALGVEIFALEYEPSLAKTRDASGYCSIGLERSSFFARHAILEMFRMIFYGLKSSIKLKVNVICLPGFWNRWEGGVIPPYIVSFLCRKPLVVVFHHLRATDFSERNPVKLFAYKHAKASITVSKATARDVQKYFKVNNITVTGNGVNLKLFEKAEPQTKVYDAVYFGRISEEKGVYTLLKAWSIVVSKIPSAKLLLMGGFLGNSKEVWWKLCSDLDLNGSVIFSGFVSDQDATRMLGMSKVLVLPSQEEGFGLTVVEAMALGLPCVLSDLPALKENFHSTAVFVKPRDVDGLAQAIMSLLTDDEKRKMLGERGRSLARQFSWENVAKKELKVLQSMLSD